MGRRSRKRSAAPRGDEMRRGYGRAEQRNETVRRGLEPLEPGERPTSVTVAAVIAVVLAVANVVIWATGAEVVGNNGGAGGALLFAFIMLVAAGGMWRARYWAVLGFQALLAITIVYAVLSVLFANNILAVVLVIGIVAPASYLFWKLIRAMARLQMPERPAR